jgi:hypothetical protein
MAEPAQVLSSACRDRMCDACTGYSDGHATYRCTHRCHPEDGDG